MPTSRQCQQTCLLGRWDPRPRRPPDRQGTPGQTGGVRCRQGPARGGGDDGIIVDHNIEAGNPTDAPQLAPAVERVTKRAGRPPRKVTADRGYGEKKVDDELHDLGVKDVVIPRKGKPSAARQDAEHQRAFRKTVKWRTGVEGRISTLKRGYGWDRTRIDTTEGARTWVGYGVLAHNLVKISTLTAT